MKRLGVMHLVDSLHMGGTERVAVNLVNSLPRDRYSACLCTTRLDGPLASLVQADVGTNLFAAKTHLDWGAIRRLVNFIRTIIFTFYRTCFFDSGG